MVVSSDTLNPFFHRPQLTSTYDKIMTGIFTVLVLPVRILLMSVLLVLAWGLACIGLYGLSHDDLSKRPMAGWRLPIKTAARIILRLLWMVCGFHYVSVKGKRVTRQEAPILVMAPHTSFCDMLPVLVVGAPSFVSRIESSTIPVFGKLVNFTQPVYVGREDRDSRLDAIQNIIDRATSEEDWSQIAIFPEGTCTNRSCFITFKPGAFYPGLPVQPVLIRYPNKVDTVTWTWDGPGWLKLCWLILTRVYINCELEFLPVYIPNDEEKKDPKLFADNVRNAMSKTMGIPMCESSYEDCTLLAKANSLELPITSHLILTHKFRSRLGLTRRKIEEQLMGKNLEVFKPTSEMRFLSKSDFADILAVDETDQNFQELFQMYSQETRQVTAMLNLQNYLLVVYITSRATNKKSIIRSAFDCYENRMRIEHFQYIMWLVYFIPYKQSEQIFRDIAFNGQSTISYDQLLKYVEMFPNIVDQYRMSENNYQTENKIKDM